jgi:hypothetical protein
LVPQRNLNALETVSMSRLFSVQKMLTVVAGFINPTGVVAGVQRLNRLCNVILNEMQEDR